MDDHADHRTRRERREHLLALEHEGWGSLCDGTGAAFYGALMTADGVMVLAHGLTLDREQVIASLDDAPTWDAYEIREPRLIDAGREGAVLAYRGRARRGEDRFTALMSSHCVHRDGRWRLALYQQTVVPSQD
ncbi:nuclear transport factor 2 family protein [Brachybacterium squillarum]|uniref:nuclear transport factor 2 family protein n=1 Tax=Brachybacterium squillarum TaxID=661979 RepID=UPI00026297E1|nr:nuclear transport factor 2 family protein [Brachybacterium squillarum]